MGKKENVQELIWKNRSENAVRAKRQKVKEQRYRKMDRGIKTKGFVVGYKGCCTKGTAPKVLYIRNFTKPLSCWSVTREITPGVRIEEKEELYKWEGTIINNHSQRNHLCAKT